MAPSFARPLARKACLLAGACVVAIGVFVAGTIVHGHLSNITGRSGPVTVNVMSTGCTNPEYVEFAGHRWETSTPAYASWGRGPETGRFRVASSTRAVFTSDVDHHSIGYYRLDGFSSLPCAGAWLDKPGVMAS